MGYVDAYVIVRVKQMVFSQIFALAAAISSTLALEIEFSTIAPYQAGPSTTTNFGTETSSSTSASAAATSSSGTILVASYNVAGLPQLINSAHSERVSSSKSIGERINIFDIVNMQEDFNYHAYIYSTDDHKYRTATSGGAAIGSGLNTVSNYSWTEFERIHWKSCQFDSGDCLTPKGFTFARTEISSNMNIDLYNLHANAGDDDGDLASRRNNFAQLQEYIEQKSMGNAVIVMGDTNSRYSRSKDTIAEFADALNLTDAWIKLERNNIRPSKGSGPLLCGYNNTNENTCEVVDKIMYRGSEQINMQAIDFQNYNKSFLNDDGVMLSDHSPIAATLQWSILSS